MQKKSRAGFSLIELIIVIGIISLMVLGLMAIVKNQTLGNLEGDALIVATRIKEAQTRSITGIDGAQWGIQFDNTGSVAWYALFKGAVYSSAIQLYYLSNAVTFTTPAGGTSSTVLFQKLDGKTSDATIVLKLVTDATQTKTITVSQNGNLSVQ